MLFAKFSVGLSNPRAAVRLMTVTAPIGGARS